MAHSRIARKPMVILLEGALGTGNRLVRGLPLLPEMGRR